MVGLRILITTTFPGGADAAGLGVTVEFLAAFSIRGWRAIRSGPLPFSGWPTNSERCSCFLNGKKKKSKGEYLVTHGNYMKFKSQGP